MLQAYRVHWDMHSGGRTVENYLFITTNYAYLKLLSELKIKKNNDLFFIIFHCGQWATMATLLSDMTHIEYKWMYWYKPTAVLRREEEGEFDSPLTKDGS